MGKGLIFGALSGFGKSIANSASEYQKFQDDELSLERREARADQRDERKEVRRVESERTLMQERAALEEEKESRVREANAAPAKRFGASVAEKLQENIPIEAEPVTRTTSAGAKAVGLKDGLINMSRKQVEAYQDPDMLSQYDKQLAADQGIAQKGLIGSTRKRTSDEAIKAAIEKAEQDGDLQGAEAGNKYMAGKQNKTDLEEKKLASKEKIEQMRIEQRDRSDDKRFEAMIARIEQASGGKGGNATALRQNVGLLQELGYGPEKIEKFIFDKKEMPLEDIAAKLLQEDRKSGGNMTEEQAAQQAVALRNAVQRSASGTKPASQNGERPPLSSFMKGEKPAATKPSRESFGAIKY